MPRAAHMPPSPSERNLAGRRPVCIVVARLFSAALDALRADLEMHRARSSQKADANLSAAASVGTMAAEAFWGYDRWPKWSQAAGA